MARKKKYQEEESFIEEDYVSMSSIDNPPKEEKEKPAQTKLFGDTDEAEDHEISVQSLLNAQRPDSFDFKMELKLKAGNQTHSVPVAAGHCFGDRIEEILEKQFSAAYFKARLRAIVGEPLPPNSETQQSFPGTKPANDDTKATQTETIPGSDESFFSGAFDANDDEEI